MYGKRGWQGRSATERLHSLAKERIHKPEVVQITGKLGEKLKAAELAAAAIEKQFGAGSITVFGKRKVVPVEVIPTGVYGIDKNVIRAGGFPRGRIVEVFGPESSGKTTIALTAVAAAQAMGELAAFVDAEHALDPTYAGQLGVDLKNLYFSQPDSGEEGLEITETLVRSGAFGIVVVDSVAALVPQAELDGEMGDSHVGLQARLMSQACRMLTGAVRQSNTCLVFTNQIREKIGVMFGSPETTPGGRALKFYSSLRLDIRRIGTNKEGDEAVSNKTRIKAVKNKVGNPYGEAECDLEFGVGFNKVGSWLDEAVSRDIVEKSGSWFNFNGERLGQGRDAVSAMLGGNAELFEKIKAAVEKQDNELAAAA